MWIGDSGTGQKMQVAVQRLEHEKCPWREVLSLESGSEQGSAKKPAAQADVAESVQAKEGDNASGYAVARRWHRYMLDVPLRVIVHRRGKSSIFIGRGNEVSEGGMAVTAGVELKPGPTMRSTSNSPRPILHRRYERQARSAIGPDTAMASSF